MANWVDQVRMLSRIEVATGGISLAGWGGPDEIVALERESQGVSLGEGKGVVGLGVDVDASDVKACFGKAYGGAATAAEQVEGLGFGRHLGIVRGRRWKCQDGQGGWI